MLLSIHSQLYGATCNSVDDNLQQMGRLSNVQTLRRIKTQSLQSLDVDK